jgi:Uma2 family endonuclease
MHSLNVHENPSAHVDQRIFLHDVSWKEFEAFLRMRGESSAVRVAYLEGELELMTPSIDHESYKKRIARLVETWALHTGVELNGFGSWTIKSAPKERGVEPDECYVVGDREVSVPDLAIEVMWTPGGIDKFVIYHGLGVGELWVWRQGTIEIWGRTKTGYTRRKRSSVLRKLDLELLSKFVDEPNQTRAARAYLRALQRE